jgi:dCMP deaminase
VYVTGLPVCSECAKGLIQVGVKQVIMPAEDISEALDTWKKSFELTTTLFAEAGIEWRAI